MEEPSERVESEAVYALEHPAKCSSCNETVRNLHVVRLLRTKGLAPPGPTDEHVGRRNGNEKRRDHPTKAVLQDRRREADSTVVEDYGVADREAVSYLG